MSAGDDAAPPAVPEGPASLRIDKWLFNCRAAKSRTVAAKLVGAGCVQINDVRTTNPARLIRPGDVVTIDKGTLVLVYRIQSCGTRRGPAAEARLLYDDLSPPRKPRARSALDRLGPVRPAGSGRPTKRERRKTDQLRIDRDPAAPSRDGDHNHS